MTRWFVSDTHFNHANILKFYPNQPWKDIQARNEGLIERWNARVKPGDRVYHLGDVTLDRKTAQEETFIRTMSRLQGYLSRLLVGNHDHFRPEVYLRAGFENILGTWRDEENILYSHFPVHPSSLGGVRANVHGHIHDQDSPKPVLVTWKGKDKIVPYINVCVERTDYAPISLDELQARIDTAIKTCTNPQTVSTIDPGSKA